jgi:hypothetical protein
VEDFVSVAVLAKSDEPADAFNKRLIAFWSNFLRTFPEQYKRVYAESVRLEAIASTWIRKYLVGVDAADILARELAIAGLAHEPIDAEDVYSKYEAAPPEWFLIPH